MLFLVFVVLESVPTPEVGNAIGVWPGLELSLRRIGMQKPLSMTTTSRFGVFEGSLLAEARLLFRTAGADDADAGGASAYPVIHLPSFSIALWRLLSFSLGNHPFVDTNTPISML